MTIRSSRTSAWRKAGVLVSLLVPSCLVCSTSRNASADRDPFAGRDQFPGFRNLSGLAGGGFGVDEEGYGSLSGPVAFSTPVAHVLGRSQWRLGVATASFDRSPTFDRDEMNGTAMVMYGHTLGRFNVAGTYMLLSTRDSDNVINLQAQYMPGQEESLLAPGAQRPRWSGSVGVQDIAGSGGSAGESRAGDKESSRSFFGVATYRLDTGQAGDRPLYLSAGIGTRRFRRPFGSISYQVARPVRLWAEYDGFGINAGVLAATQFGEGRRRRELTAGVGLLKGKYLALSAGVGF